MLSIKIASRAFNPSVFVAAQQGAQNYGRWGTRFITCTCQELTDENSRLKRELPRVDCDIGSTLTELKHLKRQNASGTEIAFALRKKLSNAMKTQKWIERNIREINRDLRTQRPRCMRTCADVKPIIFCDASIIN